MVQYYPIQSSVLNELGQMQSEGNQKVVRLYYIKCVMDYTTNYKFWLSLLYKNSSVDIS